MKSKEVWNTITTIDGKDIPEPVKLTLTSMVEDISKMEERMTAIEKKVDGIERKVDTLQMSVEQLSKLVSDSINQRQTIAMLMAELIKNKWFWLWFVIFTIIIGGGSISELANIIHIGG